MNRTYGRPQRHMSVAYMAYRKAAELAAEKRQVGHLETLAEHYSLAKQQSDARMQSWSTYGVKLSDL